MIAIFKSSWLNILLIFIPLSVSHSFLAIIPLDKVCTVQSFADLSLRLGQTLAGLLNVTLVMLTVTFNADACILMKQHVG
ncbi:hypothetical protein BGY98DRAFT_1002178 [Russula aff. rugulosa BPL654]|nr:hypothetical protein BGY98DRAFT_1002178 [Russula aff. rugulosa BPL654]